MAQAKGMFDLRQNFPLCRKGFQTASAVGKTDSRNYTCLQIFTIAAIAARANIQTL